MKGPTIQILGDREGCVVSEIFSFFRRQKKEIYGSGARLGEQLTVNQEAVGSIPTGTAKSDVIS